MTITQLKKEILKAVDINKGSIDLDNNLDVRTVELLENDYDDLKGFIIRCFKDYEKGE